MTQTMGMKIMSLMTITRRDHTQLEKSCTAEVATLMMTKSSKPVVEERRETENRDILEVTIMHQKRRKEERRVPVLSIFHIYLIMCHTHQRRQLMIMPSEENTVSWQKTEIFQIETLDLSKKKREREREKDTTINQSYFILIFSIFPQT